MGIHKNEKDIIFMPDAYAEVDPIKSVNGLMGQRKRWINGSMFAFEKVQKEISYMKYAEQSFNGLRHIHLKSSDYMFCF